MTTTAPERATDQDAGAEAAAEVVDEVLSSRGKTRLSKWGVPALLAAAGVALAVGGLALTWGGGDQKRAVCTAGIRPRQK
ncbi:hypothetical protein ACFVJK_45765 [Streptomyces sp. NPDC127172]|uniref:hypothetical protein n=1 Tax=Streptomyces sp. NPDC127172 TaxID=3345382 RepID=UPI00363A12C1